MNAVRELVDVKDGTVIIHLPDHFRARRVKSSCWTLTKAWPAMLKHRCTGAALHRFWQAHASSATSCCRLWMPKTGTP